MTTRKIQRDLYLAQRTLGDIDAAKRGQLGKRVARRYYHRALIRFLHGAGIWTPGRKR